MESLKILSLAVLFFLCLWTALLARFKGYSAACWALGGGIIGIVVLIRLPAAGREKGPNRVKGNRLGLILSGLSILSGFLLAEFL